MGFRQGEEVMMLSRDVNDHAARSKGKRVERSQTMKGNVLVAEPLLKQEIGHIKWQGDESEFEE